MSDLDGAVLVALGSNQAGVFGDKRRLLEAALERFPDHGLRVKARSRWWRSHAWPDPADPPFLNGVAWVETAAPPDRVLQALMVLEVEFGRARGRANGPRTLDLDLVAHGRTRLDTADLRLPHPRAQDRLFVMGPIAEVAPGWRHPVSGVEARALAQLAPVGRDAKPLVPFRA